MEAVSLPAPGLAAHKQGIARRTSGAPGDSRDLWSAAQTGSIHDVDVALLLLKKSNGNIDARNVFGSTALHNAVWRNHIPIIRRLLAAGANPDVRDGESGWSSLHRALHFGHLAVAAVLVEAGASLVLEDTKGRTPIDLLSGPVQQAVANPENAGAMEVYSWGNGANYQLGTGTAGIHRIPCRIDALQSLDVTSVAAAKFHSAAITASGAVYTWGFGRGGRLGHPDFDIHSGQVAVITPRQVICGIGSKRVKVIAVAKHHTIVATDGGEVFTWGSNREGRLGYPSVDTQATPRRVSTLRGRVVAVAAANKHSAVLTEGGEVFTWGCNREGQLGYGTSNSASNYVPHAIEHLKGRNFVAIAAAKYHTLVLGAEGEVLTWGYKMVNPRRVVVSRNTKKAGNQPLKFHKAERLHVSAIAAGMVHSTAITEDGLIFYWMSGDPNLHTHQLISMTGHQAVAVAAGKFRTAVATSAGSIYAWDGEGIKGDSSPVPVRVHGIKHATSVSVGESHSLSIAALYVPIYSSKEVVEPLVKGKGLLDGEESLDEDFDMDDNLGCPEPMGIITGPAATEGVPSLKDLCQKVIAEAVLEPKNALQLLEVADGLGADHLRRHCEDLVLRNLDYILTISPTTFAQIQPTLLAELEKSLDSHSTQAWSHRLLPTPSATLPAVVDSEEDESDASGTARRVLVHMDSGGYLTGRENAASQGFLLPLDGGNDAVVKQLRAVRKKLQQIEALELKQSRGHTLDTQQLAKLQTKFDLEEALLSLESGILPTSVTKSLKMQSSELQKSGSKAHAKDEDLDTEDSSRVGRHSSRRNKSSVSSGFKEIAGFTPSSSDVSTNPLSAVFGATKVSKKKTKKGGLSMFLSGALEAPPKLLNPSPPPLVKVEGPAWGGAPVPKTSASLKEIQTQQTVEVSGQRGELASVVETRCDEGDGGGLRLPLSSFVRSSAPIAVTPPKVASGLHPENSPPPWAGASPGTSAPSLRDIQLQQVKHKAQQRPLNARGSPQLSCPVGLMAISPAVTVQNPDHGSLSIDLPNRWYRPETASPSSLRCIQIEEEAMKELRRMYKNVKLVRQVDIQ
ncbi:unnamed protein product [Sphagnum troendelagicum]